MPTASQISRDPALESSLFWEQYKVPIIALAAVLILGGLGFAGYQFYAQERTASAAALLASASSDQEFQTVIERYPGSEAAASAYLLLAQDQRAKRDYAGANATLHKFIDQYPKHELITSAWMAVTANLESLGKSDEALSTYQRLVAEYPQSFSAPLALLAEIPLLKARNRFDDVRKICETLLSQYRDNIVGGQALEQLRDLPKPTPKPAPATASKKP
jgi:tetratricopeptide (TPR) repeat protein